MSYTRIALVAMLIISLAPPLSKFAVRGMAPRHLLLVSSSVMLAIHFFVSLLYGENVLTFFTCSKESLAAYALGGVFATAILLYYKAIALGPISSVIPIWSLQVIAASVMGVLLFKEAITVNKVIGIALALMAIWFISRPS